MRSLTTRLRCEEGVAMVLVVVLVAVLGILALTLISLVTSETSRSGKALVRDTAFQAAEAGVYKYTAKLVDDRLYYTHYVDPAESTRRATSGALTASPSSACPPAGTTVTAWTGGSTWTYSNGTDNWCGLGNGYEYNLQITPPTAASPAITIVATGRRVGSATDTRVVQTLIRPSSVADFQMLANKSISYGGAATTYGKIYAGVDDSGNPQNVTHNGTAYGNIYAEGSVNGSTTLRNGAQTYNGSTIRTVIKKPVAFNDFLTSLIDIQRAAQSGSRYFDDPTVDAWRMTFQSDGTLSVQRCNRTAGKDVAEQVPTCGASTSYTVPANGAIYTEQTAIVSGAVNGRVTLAANNDIVIADNISYVATGDDVFGLVAKNDMIVAAWGPSNLSWRAATIAQSGRWTDWCGAGAPTSSSACGTHSSMTFTGSTATNQGGSMSMFGSRVYQYDDSLAYLPPPWFPVVEDAYTVLLSRELTGT